MAKILLPPTIKELFDNFEKRISRLESSKRFTAPLVSSDPTNPRPGDIWLNTTSNTLKSVDKNGTVKTITWV